MTTIDITQEITAELGAKANRHLWGHFARHDSGSAYVRAAIGSVA